MAHHSQTPDPEMLEALKETIGETELKATLEDLRQKIGATGRLPHGKLTASDVGEIRMAVGAKDGKVVMHFGQPTEWVGMTPAQAKDMARLLVEHAQGIE